MHYYDCSPGVGREERERRKEGEREERERRREGEREERERAEGGGGEEEGAVRDTHSFLIATEKETLKLSRQ